MLFSVDQFTAALQRRLHISPDHAESSLDAHATGQSTRARLWWNVLSGPLFTLGTAITIELLSHTIFYIPVPHAVMFTAVMYAAFSGGMRIGFVSILIMIAYTLYYFAVPGQFLHYSSENLRRILVLFITAPAMVVVAGLLKKRTELLARTQVARVRAEAALALAETERTLLQESNARLNHLVAERTRDLAEKVTALAQANAELQTLDQLRADFLALVSHQMRAPLANLRGAVDVMQLDATMARRYARELTILNGQIASIDQLVQKVLNTARVEAAAFELQCEPVSILPMLQQAVHSLHARLSDHDVHLPDATALPLVFADRTWIVEVLMNVLDNAAKYTPAGRPIVIDVGVGVADVTIAIRDSGAGLPQRELERVFEKYYRIDSSDAQIAYGYGLGLFICRRLIDAHGGRIWAANHADGGAVFAFTLPRCEVADGG